MLAVLIESFRPLLRGGRLGLRLRVKPSWSARVYGTWSLPGRFFAFALILVLSTTGLFLRLLVLNLAEPGIGGEVAAVRRANAHHGATREVRVPALTARLAERMEEAHSTAHKLDVMIGAGGAESMKGGVGRFDDGEAPGVPLRPTLVELEHDVAALVDRYARLATAAETRGEQFRRTPSVVPIFEASFIATSPFGPRVSPFTALPEQHRGQDLAAEMYTKIVATADGTVVHVERDERRNGMGRYLILDHRNRLQTYYGHCERIFVEVGDTVRRHQIIAEVGNTGRSTGPHVHYEVRVEGEAKDPRHFMLFDPRFSREEQLRFE